jgi:hypothetical protein
MAVAEVLVVALVRIIPALVVLVVVEQDIQTVQLPQSMAQQIPAVVAAAVATQMQVMLAVQLEALVLL